MKKLLSLVMAAMMLFSLSAVAMAEDEAGFDEFELGVEGEQDVGFMTMSMVYFQPVDMAPVDQATAKENTDLHIEVDLTAKENRYAFKEVCSGSMMPMAASDGPHYGNNIKLADGEYSITLYIKSPAENGYLLHVDSETGVDAKDGFWTEPLEATLTGWKFVKQW